MGTSLMDLSGVCDSLPYNLIIPKLEGYGLDYDSLTFMSDYLMLRKQRTRIDISYSYWTETFWGIPQSSILDPLFFSIFIEDIFFFAEKSEVCNFTDDNT